MVVVVPMKRRAVKLVLLIEREKSGLRKVEKSKTKTRTQSRMAKKKLWNEAEKQLRIPRLV